MEIQRSDRKVGMECFAWALDWPVGKKDPIVKMMPTKGVLAERPDIIGHKDGDPKWFIPYGIKDGPLYDSAVQAASLHICDNMKDAVEAYRAQASARDRAMEQRHGTGADSRKDAVDRKGPYTIYYGEWEISMPITDRRRAELGFRVLEQAAKRELSIDIGDGPVLMDRDGLLITDGDGQSYRPDPDLEWEGSRLQREAFDDKECERLSAQYPGRSLKEIYWSIDPLEAGYRKDDSGMLLTPETCSYDKAAEIQNFFRHGMADSVQFIRQREDGSVLQIDPKGVEMLDGDYDPVDLDDEPGWAEGQISRNVAFLYDEADSPEEIDDLEAAFTRYHVEDAFAEIDEAGGVDRLLAGKRDEMDELADGLSSMDKRSGTVSRSEMDELAAGLSIDEQAARQTAMGREEMVQNCYARMDSMTWSTLAEKAGKYFDLNSTMPGEKRMKEVALAQRGALRIYRRDTMDNPDAPAWEWNQGVPEKYAMDHKEFMQAMSQIAVKEVKLSGENRPMKTANVMPFDKMISKREPDQRDEKCSVHSFSCSMHGEKTGQELFFSVPDYGNYVAVVPKGFATNHPNMAGMKGAVTASDYSKGKGGISAVTFTIDLMQEPELSMKMSLDKPSGMNGPGGPDDDDGFAKAVEELSGGDSLGMGR